MHVVVIGTGLIGGFIGGLLVNDYLRTRQQQQKSSSSGSESPLSKFTFGNDKLVYSRVIVQ